MRESIRLVDAVLYVVDARIPAASMNPNFDGLVAGKRVVYVFNKSDLVEKSELSKWTAKFSAEGKCFAVTDCSAGDVSSVLTSLRFSVSDIIERYAAKGVNKSIRAMVVGVPNSGKSTLINALCRSKKTLTGDKAGVTRGKQWVSVDKQIDLLDTPGTLWAAFDNQEHARDLAYVGSINDDVLDFSELALAFVKKLQKIAPSALKERYGIEIADPLETLGGIAKARKFLLKGGEPDYERAARALIDDFRKGRLGKITLERCSL